MIDDRQREKLRKCLSCQRMFLSAHAGNRICPGCAAHAPTGGLRQIQLDRYSIARDIAADADYGHEG